MLEMQVDQLVFFSNEILKTHTTDTDSVIRNRVTQSIKYLEYALQLNPQPFQQLVVNYQLGMLYTKYTENKDKASQLITRGLLDSKILSNEYYHKFLDLQSELFHSKRSADFQSQLVSAFKKGQFNESIQNYDLGVHVIHLLALFQKGDYKQAQSQLPQLHMMIEQQTSIKWYAIGYILSALAQCKTDIKKSIMYLDEGRKFVQFELSKQKTFLNPLAMLDHKQFLSKISHLIDLLHVDLLIASSEYIAAFNTLQNMNMDDAAVSQVNRLFRILNIKEISTSAPPSKNKFVSNLGEAIKSTNTNETKKLLLEIIKYNQDYQLNSIALFMLGDIFQLTNANQAKNMYEKSKYLGSLVYFKQVVELCDARLTRSKVGQWDSNCLIAREYVLAQLNKYKL
ncbi:hypothetical protein HDV01_006265 [Terramyces sp. JEL0728]|nr:hypothetical protein HDV01_006265 [Terramyces sp. JEL0728]